MKIKLVLMISMLLILSSCSTLEVNMDFDSDASFANLKTYYWLPEKSRPSGDPKLDSNELLHQRIRNAMETWFNSHGYIKAAGNEADFLISYYVVVEKKTEISVLQDSYAYPNGWGRYGYANYPGRGRSYAYEYEQGTMIIDIVNNKTRKLMWRGTAVDELQDLQTPEKKQAKINEVVSAILAKFPPEKH